MSRPRERWDAHLRTRKLRGLWLWLFACGALAVSSVVWWPAQHADITPLFERTDRPPHPRSVYYPPGEPAPKVPGDPGWSRS